MGGAGDEAETDWVYERPTAHHRNDVALRTVFAIYSQLCTKRHCLAKPDSQAQTLLFQAEYGAS